MRAKFLEFVVADIFRLCFTVVANDHIAIVNVKVQIFF